MPNNSKPNRTKDNHYVPKFLLKHFTDGDGKVWVYDSKAGKVWPTMPESAGFECRLYPQEVEDSLTACVDTPGATAIARLVKRERLDGNAWKSFLRFVAAQMLRTPSCFERLTALLSPVMQESVQRLVKFDTELSKRIKASLMRAGASGETADEHVRALADGRYSVRTSKEYSRSIALRQIPNLADTLLGMKWLVLRVSPDDPDLAIGDHPVILHDDTGGPLGLNNPNIELMMPLSRRVVVIADWSGTDSFGELCKGSVEVLNERTLRHAQRFVFASSRSEGLLQAAKNLRGTGPRVRHQRVRAGQGLAIICEYS